LIASAGGLLLDNLYRDNAFVRTTWLGNDAVTLFLVVPLLVLAMVFAGRGSLRAQLVWLGALDYMLYNYAFYLFGSAFNAFFLIYTALVGLSIFALIFGLASLDMSKISREFSRVPVKWIGGYFLFVALGLSLVYLAQSIGFILTGQLPSIVVISEHTTNVVFALDFTLLIPWLVIGAIWLVKRQPSPGDCRHPQCERTAVHPGVEREQHSGGAGGHLHHIAVALMGYIDPPGSDRQRLVLPPQILGGAQRWSLKNSRRGFVYFCIIIEGV
jgi:hypothetical protein